MTNNNNQLKSNSSKSDKWNRIKVSYSWSKERNCPQCPAASFRFQEWLFFLWACDLLSEAIHLAATDSRQCFPVEKVTEITGRLILTILWSDFQAHCKSSHADQANVVSVWTLGDVTSSSAKFSWLVIPRNVIHKFTSQKWMTLLTPSHSIDIEHRQVVTQGLFVDR